MARHEREVYQEKFSLRQNLLDFLKKWQKDCTELQVLLTRFSYYTYKQNNMNIF